MNKELLLSEFERFKPTHVFHLAAKANLKGKTVADFPENTIGTDNIVHCVNSTSSVHRLISFSTQYVVRPGVWPEKNDFFAPYTPYGESKAVGENIVRTKCTKSWVILRPTNVWGPLHPFFPYEMWRYLQHRLYMHPGYRPIIKYYSYIDNAIDQIYSISFSDSEHVINEVFYITDPPINNAEWLNAFSIALSGRPIKKIPKFLWRLLALSGDVLNRVGLIFPMSSDRFFRLTVDECIPYESTINITGLPRVSLKDGVKMSVEWFQSIKLDRK
jgi:nucleoside-diphosphate-sugar epimerase